MDAAKKLRTAHRTAFTKALNELNTLLQTDNPDKDAIAVSFEILQHKMIELDESSAKVLEHVITSKDNDVEKTYEAESDTTDEYKKRFLLVQRKTTRVLGSGQDVPAGGVVSRTVTNERKKTFKLQKIEIVKFDGNARNWLLFWSQFRKIHEDPEIDEEDKFQHLIQAMENGSRAYELVLSYPPTRENYQQVFMRLKNRFGRDDLQVEVYIRELLSLVLNNALRGKEKSSIAGLYDKLTTHMKALETLGVTSDKCAAMLFPLVESSIPEEVLRAWQRSSAAGGITDSKERLNKLMEFLCAEVEGEERIILAVSGFSIDGYSDKVKQKKAKSETLRDVPTAMGLLTTKSESASNCVFCTKDNHQSSECSKAKNLTLSERRQVLKENSCCFNCLKRGHDYKRCKSKPKCAKCNRKHVTLMCPGTPRIDATVGKAETKADVSTENDRAVLTENNLASYLALPEVYLQTLRVKMRNGHSERTVRVLIDTGSQRSYVTRKVAASMMYEPVDKREIAHTLFGAVKSRPEVHNVYLVHLSSLRNDYHCNFHVMDQGAICGNIPSVQIQSWADELQDKGIYLTDVGKISEPIDLLIGADVAAKLYTGRKCELGNGLTAVETHLGWTVMGKCKDTLAHEDTVLFTHAEAVDEARVCDLWHLDVLGIEDPQRRLNVSERNLVVKQRFKETTTFNNEARYEVALSWISDHSPLPSNKDIALKRLNSIMKRLKDLEKEEYHKVFCEWENDGVIERVPDDQLENFAHYLPHRPVIKMSSRTTKVRPVFDASAREKNFPSINQCLEKGVNYIELIPIILLKFREKRIGVIADIKRAFLQISIIPEDRDFLRFFWYQDDTLITYRHKRVVFGLTCSPFLLGATIDLHLDKISDGSVTTIATEETTNKLRKCFYSDNCVSSCASMEEILRFKEEATDALRTAGFELRDWQYSGDGGEPNVAVLGLLWDKQKDCLSVNLSSLKDVSTENITKRMMLSVAQRVFDPIGFTCPVMICPKILLQKTWKENVNWDDEVDDSIKSDFSRWFDDLSALEKVRIPRALGELNSTAKVSFHAFADASGVAYASTIFIRIEQENSVGVQLIGAKTRVSPTKEMSIPRLELLAATITARLAESLLKVLNFSDSVVIFWSDSTTVLTWINREAQWNTFVWNRVQEIRKLTAHASWRHVPGRMNPADLPSRGCTPSQLCASHWWEGPDWLKMPCESWPSQDMQVDEDEVNREVKKSSISSVVFLNECSENSSAEYFRYFSRYSRIVKMVAWIRRFIVNSRITRNEKQRRYLEPFLSTDELNAAEITLLKIVQNEMFKGENDDKFKTLDIFKDENGLLRVKTRIFNRDDSMNFRCPVVLSPTHSIVQRIIEEEHCNLVHAGIQILLCHLRERYWILSARRKIRSVVNKCVRCKRYNTKRLESAKTPLPIERVRDAYVFEVVGVDLAGPLYLKGNAKAYICLFTCAVFRAIHLELLTSLSTTCFVKGLSRFTARRGRPAVVFSDNGTNFVGMENELKKLNWQTIAEYSAAKRIKWNFNPPSAAWWGGWWERLVRIIKQLLRRTLAKTSVNYEDMLTILCDCESVINSRPLTYVSSDSNDLAPLTPSMFLQEVREIGAPDLDYLFAIDVVSKANYLQKLKNCLRKRFRTEYLGHIKETRRVHDSRKISVGDLVLIGDDNSKRIDWPLGKVIAAIPGKDGCVRVCRLKTQSGELVRPVQRLYPLELDCVVGDEFDEKSKDIINRKGSEIRDKWVCESKNEPEAPLAADVEPRLYVTRSGRVVKNKRVLDV